MKLLSDINLILVPYLDEEKLKVINRKLEIILSNYEIKESTNQLVPSDKLHQKFIGAYLVSRKIEGLSEKTLMLYKLILEQFLNTIQKQIEDITTTDIRLYLYKYQQENKISNRTLENRRNIICTFFKWLVNEEYIIKNPALKVEPIKFEKIHKRSMSQMELERIRNACKDLREKLIIEILFSTGCRVSELQNLNKTDINFETKEVILYGKGNKHRTSYINAKTEVLLKEYLASRTDNNPALLVSSKKPYRRLLKPGIEKIIRDIRSRVPDVTYNITPHVFRHTTATMALNRGMNVVDVSKFLGHSKIETTMEYITSSSESIKSKHFTCIV